MLYNGHSSSEQLDQLSRQPAGSGGPWAHIESCVQCKTTLEKYRKLNVKLDQLAANGVRSTSTMNCPDERIWLEVAAGTLSPEESLSYSSHAATCDACAKKLQAAVRIFDPEVTEEEERILDSLPSFYHEGSARLAKENVLAVKSVKPPRSDKKTSRRSFWRPFSYGFAGIAALVIVGFLSLGLITDNLLARGYTQKGTLEYRIAKASPPKEGTRGQGIAESERPFSLVLAELLIRTRLTLNSSNSRWLGEKGRFELIEGNLSAIDTLEKAHVADPKSQSITIDLASAYFMRGQPADLLHAEDLLLAVLSGTPSDLVAVYNLALTFERLGKLDRAITEWTHYLELDSNTPWAAEARRRLNVLHKYINQRNDISVNDSIERWETYLRSDAANSEEAALEPALSHWLAVEDKDAKHELNQRNLEVAFTLAERLHRKHNDTWLAEFLSDVRSPKFSEGLSALKQAIELNAKDEVAAGASAARKSENLFLQAGSLAGLARAQLEEVYAYQRAAEADLCIEAAGRLSHSLFSKSFPWIKIQLDLDEAGCLNAMGRMDAAQLDADEAVNLARDFGYRVLGLRARGIIASLATTRGEVSVALENDLAGLKEYWSGDFPIDRAIQFYSDILFNIEAKGFWHAADEAGYACVTAISGTSHSLLELINRYRHAKALVMLQHLDSADAEVQRATQAFTRLMLTDASLRGQVDGNINLIKAELDTKLYSEAEARLEALEKSIPSVTSHLILSRLNQIRGELKLKRGDFETADRAYSDAVSIAESDLETLTNPRKRALWSQRNLDAYKALAWIRLQEHDPTGALGIWESYKSAPLRVHSHLLDEAMLEKAHERYVFQAKLPHSVDLQAGQVIISYALLRNTLVAWAWHTLAEPPDIFTIPANGIEEMVRQFVYECSDPHSNIDQLQRDAKQLYQILIAPFAGKFRSANTLILETDSVFDNLPFEALVEPSGAYLAEKLAIVYSPGVGYWPYLRKIRPVTIRDVPLILTDPDLSPRWAKIFPPIHSTSEENVMLVRQFSNSIPLSGSDATYMHLQQNLPRADIFHSASHTFQTDDGPALLLAHDSGSNEESDLFTVSRLPTANLYRLNLVVLSACATGIKTPNIPQTLADGFLTAGVPQIITTRWNISSVDAVVFMDELYKSLLSAADAKRPTQNAARLVRKKTTTAHPYYWAGFKLTSRP